MKGAAPIFRPRKTGAAPVFTAMLLANVAAHAEAPTPLFLDDFETHPVGQLPAAPWKEETYKSGAVIKVDGARAFSGKQSLHV